MRHAAKVRTVAAGAAVLGLVLSGCSALQIRTAERDSGPLHVAVEEKAGENPTTAPPDDGIPEGMKEVSVNLGAECPVDVSLAMTDDWTEGSVTDDFHSFSRGTSMADSDMTLITCTKGYDETPQSLVDSRKKYTFSEKDSSVLAQRSGSLAAGSYWSYQGLLGPTEIFAINQKSTVMYGVLIGYKTNGRLVEIKIDMRALESDTEAAEEFKKMLPTITVDGEKVPTPRFK